LPRAKTGASLYFVISGPIFRVCQVATVMWIVVAVTSVVSVAATADVDPTKKSDFSTSKAMKPSEMKFKKAPINTDRTVSVKDFQMKQANLRGDGAPINVEEARKKQMITPQTRMFEVMKFDSNQVADLPSTLPRIRRDDFQKMMREYERGNVPTNPFENAQVVIGGNLVSIGDINQFANPRHALEAQGIPVTKAASGEERPRETRKQSVVIPGMEDAD
jgi:hypothetical protein